MRSALTFIISIMILAGSGPQASAQLSACINNSRDIFDCYSTPKPAPIPDPSQSWGGGVYNPMLTGIDARQKLKDLLDSDIDERYFKFCSAEMKCRYMSEKNYRNHQNDGKEAARRRAEAYQNKLNNDVATAKADAEKLRNKNFDLDNKGVKEAVDALIDKASKGISNEIVLNEEARVQSEAKQRENKEATRETLKANENLRIETDAIVNETVTEVESNYTPQLNDLDAAPLPQSNIDGDQDGVPVQARLAELISQGTNDNPLIDQSPVYDTNQIDQELLARAQAYLEVGASAQGQRLTDRASVYRNYQTGATLPYQGARLSDSAQETYGGEWSSETFQGYESINLLNEFSANERIQSDDVLSFHAAILADRLQQNSNPQNLGGFLRDIEVGWSIIDFARGAAKGVWISVKGTITGVYDLVFHFPESMRAIRDAIVNYEATWSAIENVLTNHLETVQNCDVDAEKCGEVVGIITGEIFQVFAGGAAIKALGVTRVGRVAEGISLVAKEYARKSAQIANKATKLLLSKADVQQVFNIVESSLSCASKKLCAAQRLVTSETLLTYADKIGIKGTAVIEEIKDLSSSAKNIGFKTGEEIKGHLGVIERWSTNFKTTRIEDAAVINRGYPEPPYLAGSKVVEFETTAAESFVRVHGSNNVARPWIMRQSDIEGLTASEIAAKFNIPEVPSQLSRVDIPSGVKIRTGIVGPNAFGNSKGAIQYEIRMPDNARIPESWFQPIRNF